MLVRVLAALVGIVCTLLVIGGAQARVRPDEVVFNFVLLVIVFAVGLGAFVVAFGPRKQGS